MSESETDHRVVAVELPLHLIRSAKADAALRGVTLKEWWAEAARGALSRPEPEEPAPSS